MKTTTIRKFLIIIFVLVVGIILFLFRSEQQTLIVEKSEEGYINIKSRKIIEKEDLKKGIKEIPKEDIKKIYILEKSKYEDLDSKNMAGFFYIITEKGVFLDKIINIISFLDTKKHINIGDIDKSIRSKTEEDKLNVLFFDKQNAKISEKINSFDISEGKKIIKLDAGKITNSDEVLKNYKYLEITKTRKAIVYILYFLIFLLLLLLTMMVILVIKIRKQKSSKEKTKGEPVTMSNKVRSKSSELKINKAQDIGRRKNQEDNIEVQKRDGLLAVVCDGMGGLERGEVASKIAAHNFNQEFWRKKDGFNDIFKAMLSSLAEANKKVYKNARNNSLKGNIGTTLVSAYIKNRSLSWVSVGDSHIYLYRDEKLTLLNEDHVYLNSLYREFLENQNNSLSSIRSNHEKDMLTSYIGDKNIMKIDYNILPFKLRKNDKIIICSDGLHGFMSDNEIQESINKCEKNIAEYLIKKVLKKRFKNQDNISIISVEI